MSFWSALVLLFFFLTECSLLRDLGVTSLIIVEAPIIDLRRMEAGEGANTFLRHYLKKLSLSTFSQFLQHYCICRLTQHPLFKKVVFLDIFAVPSAPLCLPTDTARLYAVGIHLWMLQPRMKQPSHNQWTLFGGGWSGVWV